MAHISVAPEVQTKVKAAEIANRYDVSRRVARNLWEELHTTDLRNVPRRRLKSADGVGEVTAKSINPPRSEAYRARENEVGDGVLIYTDPDSEKLKLVEENPDRAKERIGEAVSRAVEVRRRL